jgi:hypothetical protein
MSVVLSTSTQVISILNLINTLTDLYFFNWISKVHYIRFISFFVHSLVTKKYGHVILPLPFGFPFGLNQLGNVGQQLIFIQLFTKLYCIWHGFGYFGEALFWFRTYWLVCGGLLVIGYLFWKRGTDLAARWQQVKRNVKYENNIGFCYF